MIINCFGFSKRSVVDFLKFDSLPKTVLQIVKLYTVLCSEKNFKSFKTDVSETPTQHHLWHLAFQKGMYPQTNEDPEFKNF